MPVSGRILGPDSAPHVLHVWFIKGFSPSAWVLGPKLPSFGFFTGVNNCREEVKNRMLG